MMTGDMMVGILAVLPILFFIAVFVLIIMLIIRLAKNKSGSANEAIHQKLADSEELQREALRRQQELADELKEVNERLKRIERSLRDD